MTKKSLPLRLAVFDMDGTLVHHEVDYFVVEFLRIAPIVGLHGFDAAAVLRGLQQNNLFSANPELEPEFWREFDNLEIPPMRPIEGALETLRSCVEWGLRVAVATARPLHSDVISEKLDQTGLLEHISFISTWHGMEWTDKTKQLAQLCELLKIAPEESAMCGDSPMDVLGARALNFQLNIGLGTSYLNPEILKGAEPMYFVDSIAEVPAIIKRYL